MRYKLDHEWISPHKHSSMANKKFFTNSFTEIPPSPQFTVTHIIPIYLDNKNIIPDLPMNIWTNKL